MFMFKASTFLDELEAHRPDIFEVCQSAARGMSNDLDFKRPGAEFATCPAESIDYAVMEKTQRSLVLPIDVGWSDVGSWKALWEVSSRDSGGNHVRGDVVTVDTSGSLLVSEGRLLATVGVQRSDGRRDRGRRARGAARSRPRRQTHRRKTACVEALGTPDASTRLSTVGQLRDRRSGRSLSGETIDGESRRDVVAADAPPPLRTLDRRAGNCDGDVRRQRVRRARERIDLHSDRQQTPIGESR